MACYLKVLTEEMGVEDTFLMQSFDSDWMNTVLLYRVDNQNLICDLARQVRIYEEIDESLGSYLGTDEEYDGQLIELNEKIKKLKGINCVSQTLEEYYKQYPQISCKVIDHRGYEMESMENVPRIPINEFLKLQKTEEETKRFGQ